MAEERRRQILSQECLSIKNIQELYDGISYSTAVKLMNRIRNKSDRLKIAGRVHIQDYLDYFNLQRPTETVSSEEKKPMEEKKEVFRFGKYYGNI